MAVPALSVFAGGLRNPLQILGSSVLLAWYDASSYIGSDGATVAAWDDSSGNGNTLTQSTTANKPIYKTSIRNGKPVMRFDGTNDILAAASQFQPVANKATIFFVVKQAAVASCSVWTNTSTGNGTGTSFIDNAGTQAIRLFRGGNYYDTNTAIGANNWAYYTTIFRNSSTLVGVANLRINGAATSTSGGFGAANGPDLNVSVGGGAGFFNGDIGDLLICDGELTSTQYLEVEAYLKAKYAL